MLLVGPAALRAARLLALIVPAALLAGAYVSEYGFGLYPCEMCWWQRYPHLAALGFAALAFVVARSRALIVLAMLGIAVSALIGAFHAGVEYKWWAGFTECTTLAAGGGDPFAAIMDAPLIRCDQSQWSLLGISLAGFNFIFSGLGAAMIGVLVARSTRGPGR